MLTVLFYRFQKRRESTAVPSGAALFTLSDVIINDGASSLLQPQLRVAERRIDSAPYTGIYMTNYCYIAAFERYYYIADWTYNGDGTWTASCSVDVLASFRGEIALSGGYVDRAADLSLKNDNLMDSFYPSANMQFIRCTQKNSGLIGAPSGCTYILGTISGQSASTDVSFGAITYYKVTQAQLGQLLTDMMSTGSADWSQVSDLSGDVVKSVVNPLQYIVSCKMLPISPSDIPADTAKKIKFGYWEAPYATGSVTHVMEYGYSVTYTLTTGTPGSNEIPRYPDTHQYGGATWNLPMYPPYANFNLIHPAFGTFELDSAILATYPSIQIKVNINLITGIGVLVVRVATGQNTWYELFRSTATLAIDVPLTQITTEYVQLAKQAMGAVGNAAGIVGSESVGGKITAALGLANNLIDGAVTAVKPTVQSTGGAAGSFMNEIQYIYLEEARYATIPQDPASFGYASKQHVNSLPASGFVKMAHTDFSGSCTAQEREMICEFLESGVYMESIGNGGGGSGNG